MSQEARQSEELRQDGPLDEGQPANGAEQAEAADVAGETPEGATPSGVEPPFSSVEEMASRLHELTADLQRVQAEYLNYKRRVDRDRDLVLQNAKFSILSALLPVLDDVDRAREHEELDGGFKAVAESLERIVAGEGLVRFGTPGDTFDPHLHEALMHALSPHVTTTTCDKIVQAGYRIGDRVVRPALVTVVDPDPHAAPAVPDGSATAEGGEPGAGDPETDQQGPEDSQASEGEQPTKE